MILAQYIKGKTKVPGQYVKGEMQIHSQFYKEENVGSRPVTTKEKCRFENAGQVPAQYFYLGNGSSCPVLQR